MKVLIVLFCLFLTALIPCSGAVIYQLVGESGQTLPPFPVTFQLTTPNFISADTNVAAADFDSCTTGFESCNGAFFEPVSHHDTNFSSIEFFTTTTSSLFFFDLGAFGAPGVYQTQFGVGSGTLTVTQTGAAIPEPGAALLVIPALAGMLAARRFRK